jgi:molybdate transport system substrate-binding protein
MSRGGSTTLPSLTILSGGAAHGLVRALTPAFEAETGFTVEGSFGAVGAMAAKLRAGDAADLLILTAALIEELSREGLVAPASAGDVGAVATGIAVRAGDPAPGVADLEALRVALLEADAIFVPDLKQSTAGLHVAKVLATLAIADEVAARVKAFPNGATAMRELSGAASARPIGCTQVTEILATPGVTLVAPLPKGAELVTTYTAAVCARAASPAQAARLRDMLTGEAAREARVRAGFT